MATKLRVFVSSTMKDLANERHAVTHEIERFNFDPVNAEAWSPDGSKSWETIEKELLSSHLVVLLLGERYGHIPGAGPGAAEGFSVTHMEVRRAQDANIPILAFLKRLDYNTERNTDDARRRDLLREEITAWDNGLFTRYFDIYADLSTKVSEALVGVLAESYLKERVRAQAERAQLFFPSFESTPKRRSIALPPDLSDVLRRDETVLLAGAGMSLAAGYPGTHALSEMILSAARKRGLRGVNLGLSGSIQEITENFQIAYGRSAVLEVHRSAFWPPQAVRPTDEHCLAVRLFKTIVTTNHDELLERAAQENDIRWAVAINDADVPPPRDGGVIVKLAGTLSQPQSLVITSGDARRVRDSNPRLWSWLTRRISESPLVVLGHSLRDLNARALVEARPRHLPGFIIGNEIGSFDGPLFEGLGLRVVHADAQTFFHSVSDLLSR